MRVDAVIIGAGPAGLSCARILAANGVKTLLVEKKEVVGPKVCAGGLTWGGFARKIPEDLIERSFTDQLIATGYQKFSIRSHEPIIVTVNREKLGRFMLQQAQAGGAKVLSGTRLLSVSDKDILLENIANRERFCVEFEYLVGADGSNSAVRKYLHIESEKMGIGINYQIQGQYEKMEWHLDHSLFRNGYGWIFPHRDSISIGAYADKSTISALTLKMNLIQWAKRQDFDLTREKCQAEYINYDYRGWNFRPIFLAGDAAGLASALTGEGIYPAIVSGETVAHAIISHQCDTAPLDKLVSRHKEHLRMARITKSKPAFWVFSELAAISLRCGVLDFRQMEMTDTV